jgi:hypothetical protein
MNAKQIKRGFLSALSILSVIPLASAFDASSLNNAITSGIEVFKAFYSPFFEAIIGSAYPSDLFFAKTLLLLLLFVIIRTIVIKAPVFEDNKLVAFIVAFVASVFAVRYISDNELTNVILLPYGTLGIAMTTIIPFLIFFWFIHKSNMQSGGRKLAWAFYMAVFLILWYNSYQKMSDIANEIYAAMVILVILSAILDQQIKKYFAWQEIKKTEKSIDDEKIIDLFSKLKKAKEWEYTPWGARKVKEIKKELKEKGVAVPD